MKRTLLVLALLCTISSTLFAQKRIGKAVTITGEVIDTQCYLSNAMGLGTEKDHKECAMGCAKGEIPLSILESKTGTVYLAGQTKKAMTGANQLLREYIAEKVKVTGQLVEKGGMKLVLITKVERYAEP